MKKITMFAIAALLPTVAFGAYLGAGKDVSIPPVPAGNVYLVGGNVNVSGNAIAGDLSALGGTVIVDAQVNKDILAAGGTVNVTGMGAEDLRVAGGNVTVSGRFSGEIMAVGGQLVLAPASVAKDSYVAGGNVLFSGSEAGSLTVAGGDVRIDGTVNGDVIIKRANKVTIGPRAVIGGRLEYSAPQEAAIETGATLNHPPVFHKIEIKDEARNGALGFLTFWSLLKLVSMLAVAYLLWYLRRRDSVAVINETRTNFWRNLLRGFGFLVLMPVAAFILLVTVVGIIPAGIVFLSYLLMLLLAAPLSVLVATSLLHQLMKRNVHVFAWYDILLGAVVLGIAGIVPFLGWLAVFIVHLMALGGLVDVIRAKFRD